MGLGASGCMQARVQVAGRRAGCPQIPLLRGPLSPRSPWCLILQRSGREPSLRFRNPVARCLRIERLLRLPGRDHRRSVGGHPGSSVVLAALPIPRPGRTTSARRFPTDRRENSRPRGGAFCETRHGCTGRSRVAGIPRERYGQWFYNLLCTFVTRSAKGYRRRFARSRSMPARLACENFSRQARRSAGGSRVVVACSYCRSA